VFLHAGVDGTDWRHRDPSGAVRKGLAGICEALKGIHPVVFHVAPEGKARTARGPSHGVG